MEGARRRWPCASQGTSPQKTLILNFESAEPRTRREISGIGAPTLCVVVARDEADEDGDIVFVSTERPELR